MKQISDLTELEHRVLTDKFGCVPDLSRYLRQRVWACIPVAPFVISGDAPENSIGVCRVIEETTQGFHTLNEFGITPPSDLGITWEIATLVVSPQYRASGAAVALLRSMLWAARANQVETLIATIDGALYDMLQNHTLVHVPMEHLIPGPFSYAGSDRTFAIRISVDKIEGVPDAPV